MSEFGLPYMGSKDKIAKSILMMLPKADNLYDLFGGGFAISHCALKCFPKKFASVHYNEIKADIVDLMKRAIAGEFNYDRFKPKWSSRADFFANLDNPYIRVCWSFGNVQKTYLFGEDIEPYKKAMHNAVVFGEFDALASEVLGFSTWPSIAKTTKQRRLYLRQKIEYYRKTGIPKILHQFLNAKQLERLGRLEQLERLGRLQQLEQLEKLEKLTTSSLSYEQVEIKPNSVIYCDPPYEGTADYGRTFDQNKFLDWAASIKHPVFISEYNVPDKRFKQVYQVKKRAMLTSEKHKTKQMQEKLYWNGVSL